MTSFDIEKLPSTTEHLRSWREVVLPQVKTNTLASEPLAPKQATTRKSLRQRISTRESDRIVSLYAQGQSAREIATEASVGKTTVLRVLREAGIEVRPRGGHHYQTPCKTS